MGNLTSNIALIIDLATGENRQEAIEDDFYLEYVGGASASVALYDKYRDDDPIILGTGLLTGTFFPGSALGTITAMSSRTGVLSHSPFCLYGGMELKFTGFDFVVIKGQAQEPVYLWLHDQVANIHGASGLWGKDTWETTDELRRALGEDLIQVLCIGEAGERVCGASEIILNYWSIGDRMGFGDVLGRKKVKAIAMRGLGIFDLSKPAEFVEECSQLHLSIRSGSISGYRGNIEFPDYLENASLKSWVERLVHRCNSCFGCPYPCNTFLKYREESSVMQETEVQEPGFLVTDVAALLSLKKAGLSAETAANVLELCSRKSLDALAVASYAHKKELTSYDSIKDCFSGIIDSIDASEMQPWSSDIQAANAELQRKVFSTWTPPKPLFEGFGLDGGEDANVEWWIRRNALAYVTGICPIFTLMSPQIDEERVIEALKLGTDLNLSVEDLDRACLKLVG
jgi:aldehyde:ferredoxin oxidoreductase